MINRLYSKLENWIFLVREIFPIKHKQWRQSSPFFSIIFLLKYLFLQRFISNVYHNHCRFIYKIQNTIDLFSFRPENISIPEIPDRTISASVPKTNSTKLLAFTMHFLSISTNFTKRFSSSTFVDTSFVFIRSLFNWTETRTLQNNFETIVLTYPLSTVSQFSIALVILMTKPQLKFTQTIFRVNKWQP